MTHNVERENVLAGNGGAQGASDRLNALEKKLNIKLKAIRHHSLDKQNIEPNIEKFIGATQIPIGMAGPLKINGDCAKGLFSIPFATTEGTLVGGYTLGMIALSRSGGVRAKVVSQKVDITPCFEFDNLDESSKFAQWLNENIPLLKTEAEKTTSHTKLIDIKSIIIGKRVFAHFIYDSKDAMGLNTISIATDKACVHIKKLFPGLKRYYLRSNLSSDKKAAYFNMIHGYGKEVIVECTVKKNVVKSILNSTPKEMQNFWHASALSSFQSGTAGYNAQYSNALAAIYIACGQDVAQIVNASMGISNCEIDDNGDLYTCLRLPCIIVGTVGGGTNLGTQRECLELIGCYGDNKSNKFAEIIGASLLAGEVAICAFLANGEFINAHKRKRLTK